jgi:nucleoid-associated protein YgaU
MGVFDNKDDAKTSDFGDVSADTASTNASKPADFSDVTGGSSSSAAAPASQSYTVKSGDSLSHIAKHVYGDASKWHQIYDANRDKIKNPDLIQPGWVLTIPSA